MVVGRFNVDVERVRGRHVPEGGLRRRVGGPLLGVHNDLAQLGASDVVVGPELQAVCATAVPGYDTLPVGSLDVSVEGLGGGHVSECGLRGLIEGPALSQGDYFGKLSPGGGVARAEGVIAVTGDYGVAIQ